MSGALSTISNSRASSKLNNIISAQWIGIHARSSGFVQRRGNLNPVKFVEAILTAVGTPQKRDTIQAVVTEYNSHVSKGERIFYKPLHNRLRSEGCKNFLLEFVAKLQAHVVKCMHRPDFEKLLATLQKNGLPVDDFFLHDGTYWKIHESFSEQYPATRHAKKAELVENTYEIDGTPVMNEPKFAQMGMQTTYSMRSGTIIRADITAATANETDYVPKGQGKGILHLMDAGYGDFKLLHDIDSACEFFITKLKANSAAVIESVKIDGTDFTKFFAGKKLSCKEFRTFREKEVVDATVRLSDGNCYRAIRFYSKKERQARNFITNIFSNRITAKMICAIYKIRWQIELLFKDLKSGSNLTGVNTRVENIVYVMLFASLAAHFLKQLAASAVAITSGIETSLYRLSVYSNSWLREYIHALFAKDLEHIKQIIKNLGSTKGCFERVRQSIQKHAKLKTLISVYAYLYGSLAPKAFETFLLEA